MKRTFQRPLSLLLVMVLLMGLLPGTSLAAGEDGSALVYTLGREWTNASGWGEVTPNISQSGSPVTLTINDKTTGSDWRAVAVQNSLTAPDGASGVAQVTMSINGEGTNGLTAQAILIGSDSTTWYQATTTASASVTFGSSDFKESGEANGEAMPADFTPASIIIKIGGGSILPASITVSDITITAPEVKTDCTVTLSATESGNVKGLDSESDTEKGSTFTKQAFSTDGTNAVDSTTVTVAKGSTITIKGSIWVTNGAGDYLKTVKVGDETQTVSQGQDYTVTINDDTTIVADYEYLTSAPTEPQQCTVTLSATENGQAKVNNNDGGAGFTKAAFSIDGTNPVSDTTLTVDSGTKVTVLGAVWLSGTAGDYLDSVKVGGTAQTVTKGENYEITITGNTSIVADYKFLATPPVDPAPGDTYTVTLAAVEENGSANSTLAGVAFLDGNGSTLTGTTAQGDGTVKLNTASGTKIKILGNVSSWGKWLEALTVNGQRPEDFTPYEDLTITVTGNTTITAEYIYSETKPEYTPKPDLTADERQITHIVPWSADGWLTASGQTSAGYVYLKHVGGEFDTTKVREDGKFGLLYQTDTSDPGSKLFLSFSSNSDDTLPWAKVSPTKTESLNGYPNWYRSEFSVADVKAAFGSSFGYMDQIGVWMLDGLHLNAREVKLYYVDGSGAYVVADQSKDPVIGYPWRNQQNQNGGIALIGDSIVHNPRVNSEVGLKPDKGDWNAILGRENCDNYGIGGEQSQHIAARFAELTENGNYQSIVTLFGINNLGTGDETAVTNRVIADYTTVLNTAKAAVNNSSKKLEKVFVISLLPSTPLTYEGAQYRIQHVNTALKALCEGNEYKDFVTFVNVYPELLYKGDTPLDGCSANGSDNDGNSFTGYEPHGDPKFFFASDGLHPNAAGYAEIARVLNPLLGGEYASSEGVTGGDANSFGTGGWEYGGDGWSNGGTSTGSLSVTQDGMLKASVRFSSTNWSQAAISNWSEPGHDVKSGMDMISMDVYLEKSAVDASPGTMLAQIYEFGSAVPLNTSGEVVTVNGVQYYKTALNIKGTFKTPFQNFAILFIARNSAFNGNILVDNIAFQKSQNEQVIKVEGSGNFSKNADGTTKTINFGNGENAQTPTYSNSGHSGRLNKGAKIKLTIKLNDVTGTLSGKLKVTVTITGTNGQSTEVTTTIDASAFQDVTRMMRAARSTGTAKIAEVEIDIPESDIQTVGNVKTVSVKAESADKTSGNTFNYSGTLDLTELIITNGPAAITSPYVDNGGGGSGGGGGGGGGGSAPMRPVNLPHTWDFSKQADGWKYDKAWNSDYSGSSKTKVMLQDGRLRIDVDFSKDGDKSWSQLAVTLWHDSGMSVKGATHASLDFFYIPGALDGSFAMKLYSNAGIDCDAAIDAEDAEKVQIGSITYNKVTVDFNFPAIRSDKVQDLAICLVGKNTTYKGPLYIDNIALNTEGNDIYVTSKLKPQKSNAALTISGKTLTTASGEKLTLPGQAAMVDGKADENAKSLYAYLKAVGDSKDVLFGQQYSFLQKAGSADLSDSDTYDIVGDYAAIFGLDGLALSGNEFNAGRCNELYGTSYPETAAGHVAAAAYLSNKAIERGEIITLSLHMPNFSVVNVVETSAPETYARYDFSGYTPNTLTGDVANEILPGGKYNDAMNAYLDMVADYAKQVDGAVLFRPFHENTGSWFWWGKAFCDPSTYQNIFRYTVEYLRDIKGVHNFIYVYGPGSEAESLTDYAERYPGDSYVDMVGFDMYNTAPDVNSGWMKDFEKELNLVAKFAANHNKLVAVTETGAANAPAKGDSQTALLRSGNKDLDWYNRVLNVVSKSQASYFLVWANFGQTSGFYTPYVVRKNNDGSLYGHEMLDNFISYYNDSRSVFASDQKAALGKLPGVTAKAVNDKAEGYITAPISGRRVLDAATFTARVTNAKGADVQFILHGSGRDITLKAASTDGVYYRAQIEKAALETLGHYADGSAELIVNGQSQQTIKLIYNIPEPTLDRKLIDAFDTYYGVNGLLNKEWTANSGTGCSLVSSLDQSVKYNGDASLKLEYTLTKDGYAGVSRSRDTDWSGCNAVQLWTVPDGKAKKVVVQVTAGGQVYEAYLSDYPAYTDSTEPLLVTIPFSEFVQRDTSGQPKGGLVTDCKSVSGFGLWVNAVQPETVTGVLHYDNITAVENGPGEVTIVKAKNPFTDVPADAYYFNAVQWALGKGITGGTSATTFSPNNPCTRAQIVTFLWRAAGSPKPSGKANPFTDLKTGAYYYDAVLWAVEKGITSGTTSTTFSPDAAVTRGQTVMFLYRAAGMPEAASAASFTDVAADAYYAKAVQWASAQGITNGTSVNAFSPNRPCTRAQIVTFLYRAQ